MTALTMTMTALMVKKLTMWMALLMKTKKTMMRIVMAT
jgi:hypothetical protein